VAEQRYAFPPLLLGATLLFWGWFTGVLAFAAPMALVLEAARLVRWRLDLQDRDFDRLVDASGVGFVLVVVYAFDTYSFRGIYAVLQWVPFVLFFLVAAQVYSTRDEVKITALLLSMRRAAARYGLRKVPAVDLRQPYLVVCLLAASAGDGPRGWFWIGAALAAAWALWPARAPGLRPWAWAMALALVLAGGYAGQTGLRELRASIEPLVMDWFHERLWRHRDPYRAHTAIGDIGRYKASDRILLRVRPDRVASGLLLREASYRTFSRNVWLAGRTEFRPVRPNDEGITWTFAEVPGPDRTVTVSSYLFRDRGLLAMPTGAFEVDHLLVEEMKRSSLGAVKVNEERDLIEYEVRYAPGSSLDLPPSEVDLQVPSEHRALLASVVRDLGLEGLPRAEAAARLQRWFAREFRYSLVPRGRRFLRPLGDFLQSSRSGHCEYFATATILLLRTLGVPARYATGYSVQEYSPLEKQFVVRRRHSHSWALVHLDGRWQNLDTTPGVWAELEEEATPWWTGVYDLWSWMRYHWTRWRQEDSEESISQHLIWLLLPLLAILAWRLSSRGRARPGPEDRAPAPRPAQRPGLDSEIYRVEDVLARNGVVRPPGETLPRFLAREGRSGNVPGASELLASVLPAHYRYRFDPAGITTAERARIRSGVRAWLARNRSSPP